MGDLGLLLLYILVCALAGVGIFFAYSSIRNAIARKRNLKRRKAYDKSCGMGK